MLIQTEGFLSELPGNRPWICQPADKVYFLPLYDLLVTNHFSQMVEYRYIKSFYESKVTWKGEIDHLWCTPAFNNKPQYDCVMLQTHDGSIFAQLKFALMVAVNDEIVPLILVQSFDKRQDS